MRFLLGLSLSVVVAGACSAQEVEPVEPVEFYPDLVFSTANAEYDAEDGDSFWLGIHRVRLHGIDTIEATQRCRDENGDVDCHSMTLDFLERQIDRPGFECRVHLQDGRKPRMSHNRYISTCFVDGEELNAMMVREEWAVAAVKSDGNAYRTLETSARDAGLGIHQYEFEHPHTFRNPPAEDCTCPD